MRTHRLVLVLAATLVAVAPGLASALTFNLTYADGTSTEARAGFAAAADRFSALLTDPITVNLNVGTVVIANSGILGYADSSSQTLSYASVRDALRRDVTTPGDAVAVAGLTPSNSLTFQTNYFADSPNADRSIPFDGSTTLMDVNLANAKALGLRDANDPAQDGLIRFNTNFAFDYDPSDGIGADQYDFIGITTHEIGHALGFVSGVDYVDGLPADTTQQSGNIAFVQPLDLFRRSGVSMRLDMTANKTAKYFSLDNGLTGSDRLFSLGASSRGDGRQASHWKDNLGIGILDPTAGRGELLALTSNDRLAFDSIGYNAVPEPASLAALGLGALALLRRRRPA